MKKYDVIIIGAGAAGLTAAAAATKRGRRTAVFDIGPAPARKVAASGGGRCNFTNAAADYTHYFGENPDFVRGALARVRPGDILEWARGHNIKWVEKTAGRYFAADGAGVVADALVRDARAADIYAPRPVTAVRRDGERFVITADGEFSCQSLIIATGGTSYPVLGVSDFGMRLAKTFGHKIVPVRPALCAIKTGAAPSALAGISMRAQITVGRRRVCDDMLFTHFGIGGPAAYRASLGDIGDGMTINLMPGADVFGLLGGAKRTDGRKSIASVLAEHMPMRVAKWIAPDVGNIADVKDAALRQIAARVTEWHIDGGDAKYHGLQSAEVVRGGVSTREISSKTMESKLCPGLFFAGEVMDIAGDLGGFNLHWAFASGRVAGENA